MVSVSEDNKLIAKYVTDAFGGAPKVNRFWDDDHKSHIDIASCSNAPQGGATSYSTVGLSDAPLYKDGQEYGVRVEIVGACGSRFQNFDNALSTDN